MENENKAPLGKLNPAVFIVLTLAVIFIGYQIIGGIIGIALTGPDISNQIKDIKSFRVVVSFSQFMFILVPVILLNILKGDDYRRTFLLNPPDYKIFILCIIGMLAIQPFLQLYVVLQNKLIYSLPFGADIFKKMKEFFDILEATVIEVVKAHSAGEFLTVVFVIAITPAICEELLFRGLILTNLRKILRPVQAIILTGIIFAVFHFDPFNLIPLIILGIFITLAAYASNSIFTAVTIHFINNFISALAVYVLGDEFASSSRDVPPDEYKQLLIWGTISLIIFIMIIILIRKLYNNNKKNLTIQVE